MEPEKKATSTPILQLHTKMTQSNFSGLTVTERCAGPRAIEVQSR
jgi:hypothetical protein